VKRTDAAAPADTVYVVSKYTIDRLIGGEEKGLNEYREGRVVRDVAFESVQGVTVTLRGGRYTFDRGTAVDEWVAAEGNPIGAPDGVSLSAAVRLITTLRADDFLNIPGLQLGDRPIPLKELIDSFPSVIRGATSQEGGGSVAELELANVLTQNLMFIEQMASLYAVVYPESVPVAAQALRDLAGELSGTFVSLRDPILSLAARLVVPPGTVPVAWTFRLEGERRVTLRIGGLTPDGKRPVTTDVEGDEQVYLVAADALGDLALGDPNDLRKPRLLAGIPADRLVSLDYVDEARRWQFVRGGDGVWTAVQAEGISGFDPEKLAATVRRVLDLEAVKFVGLAPAQAGLEPAPVTLVLRWTGEAPPAEEGQPAPEPPVLERLIALGGTDAEGGRYVRLGGSEVDDLLASGVFLVSQAAALDLVLQPSELSASATAEAPLPDATPDTQFLQMFGGGPAPAPPPAP
jgi:hypothetical protein